MSLPMPWVERIFTKLTMVYGRDFLGRWEGLDISEVKADWAHELSGFKDHAESIAYALKNLPDSGKPPTVLEFRAMCRKAPESTVLMLENKLTTEQMVANKKRIAELIEKVKK
jgi:hypothetical protein